MKRDELTALNVPEESIDKVMSINGADIEKFKAENEKLKSTLETSAADLQAQLTAKDEALTAANAEIESYKGMDIEGVRKAADEWKDKYAQLQAEAEQFKTEMAEKEAARLYGEAVTAYVQDKGLKFSSKYAEEGFLRDLKEQGLKLSDGVLLGADDFVKLQQEKSPETFAPDKPLPELEIAGAAGRLPGDSDTKPKKVPTFF